MRLEWSRAAIADREAIFDYIEADNPRAAAAIDDHFSDQAANLLEFPEFGRVGRVEGTRESVIAGTPYIIAYRIAGDTIKILRVLHGARPWPEDM